MKYEEYLNKIKTIKAKEIDYKIQIPYWQIEKYSYFLSKGKKNISKKTILNLINSEREIKNIYIKWITLLETKLKSSIEKEIINNFKSKGPISNEYYSKNYVKNVINKNIIRILNKAKNKFMKIDLESFDYWKQKNGYIPIFMYIKYITFYDLIYFCQNFKEKHRKKIIDEMSLDLEFISSLNILREIRNIAAHDNSLLDYKSKSYMLPTNIISSSISPFIHPSQKNDDLWNKNIISGLILIKLMLSRSQFNFFENEYRKICIKLSRNLGKDNNIYFRLSGGSLKTLDLLKNINSRKLMSFNKIARFNTAELREYWKNKTGNYQHFKNKNEAIKHIVEMSKYN